MWSHCYFKIKEKILYTTYMMSSDFQDFMNLVATPPGVPNILYCIIFSIWCVCLIHIYIPRANKNIIHRRQPRIKVWNLGDFDSIFFLVFVLLIIIENKTSVGLFHLSNCTHLILNVSFDITLLKYIFICILTVISSSD